MERMRGHPASDHIPQTPDWARPAPDWMPKLPRPPEMTLPPRPTASERIAQRLGGFHPLSPQQRGVADTVMQPFVDAYDAWRGRMSEDEQKDFVVRAALDLVPGARLGFPAARGAAASVRAVSPIARGGRNVRQVRGSGPPELYDPPDLPQRPFARDYPHGARADAEGRLTHDIEGRPLDAEFVFGRRTKNGPDVGLQSRDHDRLAVAFMDKPATDEFPQRLGTSGASGFNASGRLTDIWLRRGMPLHERARVYAHELAHGIDELAGRLPTSGLMDELKPLYNTLNSPRRTPDGAHPAPGTTFTPRDRPGYTDSEVAREYAVEAIRAYMINPNYFKSVAPRTAEAIRELVNANRSLSEAGRPLSDIVQFNSLLAAPAAAGLASTSRQVEPGP